MRRVVLVFALLLYAVVCIADENSKALCWAGEGSANLAFGKIAFAVHEAKVDGETVCRFYIRNAAGKLIYTDSDFAFQSVRSDLDVDGDGHPDLIVESYSGGAHCCSTWWVFSPSPSPHLLFRIENDYFGEFLSDRASRRVVFHALDGSFDYFDGSCHACTVFPDVYLSYQHGRLSDVSSSFQSKYDGEIAEARASLTPDVLQQFRNGHPESSPELQLDRGNGWRSALRIVLSYLYSGRTEQAWSEFARIWPPWDQARTKREILRARAAGISRYTRRP